MLANRRMLFEEAVLRMAGVTEIPTFEHPVPSEKQTVKGLGEACGGSKIEKCLGWLQARAPQRVMDGKELKMVVTEHQLALTLCRVCQKG